ncbi:NMCC_0638 family (lipo)protein, partial [Enterobacter asburiae]
MVPLASGRYAVSWADDGTCTVYAEKADAAVVQKGFARLVQAAPMPLQVRSLPGRGPLSADQVAIQYGWATPGQGKL